MKEERDGGVTIKRGVLGEKKKNGQGSFPSPLNSPHEPETMAGKVEPMRARLQRQGGEKKREL